MLLSSNRNKCWDLPQEDARTCHLSLEFDSINFLVDSIKGYHPFMSFRSFYYPSMVLGLNIHTLCYLKI